MKVFLNPGHDRAYDSGAVHPDGMRECDIVWDVGNRVKDYLEAAGCEVRIMQSDNLCWDSQYAARQDAAVVPTANAWPADIFVSLHCNAFKHNAAKGTEVEVYSFGGQSQQLAQCIQNQIVSAMDMVDRGVKERPNLEVLNSTTMPACLVELGFVDNDEDKEKMVENPGGFAAAVARGITDYECL